MSYYASFLKRITILLVAEVIFVVLAVLDMSSNGVITDNAGINPRTWKGIIFGIIISPFIHVGILHVLTNAIPFLTLGSIVLHPEYRTADRTSSFSRGVKVFLYVTIVVQIGSGLFVWLVAPDDQIHTGSSSFVFGYFGYIISAAVWEIHLLKEEHPSYNLKELILIRWRAVAIAAVVIVLYWTFLWSMFTNSEKNRWEAHVSALVIGAVAAVVQEACLPLIHLDYFFPYEEILTSENKQAHPYTNNGTV